VLDRGFAPQGQTRDYINVFVASPLNTRHVRSRSKN